MSGATVFHRVYRKLSLATESVRVSKTIGLFIVCSPVKAAGGSA